MTKPLKKGRMGTSLELSSSAKDARTASLELVRYDQMCRAITESHAIDEVLNIHDNVVAIQAYARQARNVELERMALDIRLRAEKKAGKLLDEMAEAGHRETGRPPKGIKIGTPTTRITLGELGITRSESRKWRKLAKVPEHVFEAALADPTVLPTAAGIIRANEQPKSNPVSADAVLFWGRLRDLEQLLDKEPAAILCTMTPAMLDQVHTLAPKVARWLRRIGKISPAT
jgi:hypothetical protein